MRLPTILRNSVRPVALLFCGLAALSPPCPSLLADPPMPRIIFPQAANGAPKLRHDDDTRSESRDLPRLFVLSPLDLGLTTREMPSLFWFVSSPTRAVVKITLSNDADIDPVLQLTPTGISSGGIQRLDLAAQNIRLEPEVQYQFAITLLKEKDANAPSGQVFASGAIKRVRTSETLRAQLEKAQRAAKPAIFASQRIWYDALMALSDLIDADPGNAELRLARADLLDQVKLTAPADAERKAAADIRRAAAN